MVHWKNISEYFSKIVIYKKQKINLNDFYQKILVRKLVSISKHYQTQNVFELASTQMTRMNVKTSLKSRCYFLILLKLNFLLKL